MSDTKPQFQEAQRTHKKTKPQHIIFKPQKIKYKEKNLERSQRRKCLTYRGVMIRIASDFSLKIMQARTDWSEINKVLREKQKQKQKTTN